MLLKLLYLTTYSLSTVNSVLGHCDDIGHSESAFPVHYQPRPISTPHVFFQFHMWGFLFESIFIKTVQGFGNIYVHRALCYLGSLRGNSHTMTSVD